MESECRSEVVDALRDIIGDEAVRDLVATYIEDSTRLASELCAVTGDAAGAAHQLASTSAALGAESLAALCATIERSVRSGGVSPATEQKREVEERLARVHAELRGYLT